MKRRIVIGALLAALAFSMAACGSTGGTDGAADGAGQETELNQGAAKEEVEKEEEVPYAAGVWTDNVYTNESLGMTFPLPEGWQYGTQEELAEMITLERIGIVNLIYAKIIEHYGLREFKGFNTSKVEIDTILQYIYENYKEPITLESLADRFGYNPRVLSGKLSKTTGMDFRIFISDIRMQKVITMCHDKQNADMALIDIVSRCGFNCVASFYRAYKRAYNRNFKFNNLPIH